MTPSESEHTVWRSAVATAAVLARGTPHLALLLLRALRDPRISRETKSRILVTGLYVFSPVDLVPELLFGIIGYADDAMVVVGTVDQLLNAEDPQVIASLWTGHPEDLATLSLCFARWGSVTDTVLRPVVERLLSWLLRSQSAPRGNR